MGKPARGSDMIVQVLGKIGLTQRTNRTLASQLNVPDTAASRIRAGGSATDSG